MTNNKSEKTATVVCNQVSKTYGDRRHRFKGFKAEADRDISRGVAALNDVTFVAHKGESIGVIGQNGSGKSTLFRILSGKDSPTRGSIRVSSEPSLLGVAAAMQRHLTGIQNIRLGLLAMGLPKAEIEEAMNDIVKFCDIGDAINRPLSTYSSGMGARLKFAIATSVRPEILMVDEALSTGDSAFNAKATDRMRSFLNGDGTVLVVSHSARSIKEICSRAIWLHQGEVVADGPLADIADNYNTWSRAKAKSKTEEANRILEESKSLYNPIEICLHNDFA